MQMKTDAWPILALLKVSLAFVMKILTICRSHPSTFFKRSHAASGREAPIGRLKSSKPCASNWRGSDIDRLNHIKQARLMFYVYAKS
jgi:hypothetical protein